MLISFDFVAIFTEAGQHSHCDNTAIVTEWVYCPAEMCHLVEDDDADNADNEVDGVEGQQ